MKKIAMTVSSNWDNEGRKKKINKDSETNEVEIKFIWLE
jgi:hypothetical protein